MKKLIGKIKENFIKYFDIILLIYIILNILYINVASYFVVVNRLSTLKFSYAYIFFLIVNIFLIKFIVLSKKYKKNKVDYFLKLIIIFGIIATVLAYNINISLYGYYGRSEGLFAISYYMSMLFLSSFVKKEDRKKIIYAILIGGFVQVIYSIFQQFGLFGVSLLLHRLSNVYGFTTNSNFFGTLMVICISYSIGLFIDSKKLSSNIIFGFLTCGYFTSLILSCTLSAVVGLIIVLIILLIYAIKNKKVKKYILLCILLGYILSTLHFCGLTSVLKDLNKTRHETTSIVKKGDMDNSYGNGRFEVWKKSIKIAPKYLLHGVGIDNFANILDGKPIKNIDGYFDKAHNEYLQILITTGIFSLLSYLALHFIIIKNGIKNTFKNKEIYLLLPVIGYLVQAQFNISVLEVAPFFYISLGLLVDRE